MSSMTIFLVPAAIAGYLLGSLNSSLIVGKFYGIDVRKHGSGNAGTTNTLRTLGKKAALFCPGG
ncbi:MAG: glycerol-3-phosphate acyltransferase [Taibaiella sp.]|nr:glycerol-3-phosphate acyltransferase [Taibaiella sp.]